MPKKRTDAQIAASRANGRKSHGPKTPRGKTRVSLNALKAGASAHSIILPNERRSDYIELCHTMFSELNPQTYLETILVQRMVAAHWKLQRVATFERVSMIHAASAVTYVPPTVTSEGTWEEPADRDAIAFVGLHGKPGTGSVFQNSEVRYYRQFAQALSQLNALRSHRNSQNEPDNFQKTNDREEKDNLGNNPSVPEDILPDPAGFPDIS